MRLSRRPIKLVSILLAAALLLIFLHYIRLLGPVEGLVQRIIAPIQHQLYAIGTGINGFYRDLTNQSDDQSIEELQAQVRTLLVENAQLKTLLLEADREKQQIDFLAAEGLVAVTAKIIGRGTVVDEQTLIINQGSADGVAIGSPVISERGILVGLVASVGAQNAHVRLINDSLSSFGAMIQNQDLARGVINGDRGLSLKMELIPQEATLTVGDVVVTSGVEANIPRGLVIGQVEQVSAEPNELFKAAYVKTFVDFDDLIIVSILKGQYDEQNN